MSALSSASSSSLIIFSDSGKRSARLSKTSALIASMRSCRSSLSGLLLASAIRSCANSATAWTSAGSTCSTSMAIFSLPTSETSCSCSWTNSAMHSWPKANASTRSCSAISWAPPSTLTMESAVPQTMISRSESSSSARVGLATNSPLIRPTRTAPMGPAKGMSDMLRAAEAPIKPKTSASFSPSYESTET